MAYLYEHVPPKPFTGPLALHVYWLFPVKGRHVSYEYKTSRPDTDNLEKLLKDCMTRLHFWKDDAQIVEEHVMKCYLEVPGIYVLVAPLPRLITDQDKPIQPDPHRAAVQQAAREAAREAASRAIAKKYGLESLLESDQEPSPDPESPSGEATP